MLIILYQADAFLSILFFNFFDKMHVLRKIRFETVFDGIHARGVIGLEDKGISAKRVGGGAGRVIAVYKMAGK